MTNNLIPELENKAEIEKLLESETQAQRDTAIVKALQNVTLGVVNTRHALSGLGRTMGSIKDSLDQLNKNMQESSASSGRLTQALKNITLWGTIIAGVGVLVAALSLGLEFYKIQ